MSEQRLLFDLSRSVWVDKLWRTIDAKTHRQILLTLAEMGRRALVAQPPMPAKEERDEP